MPTKRIGLIGCGKWGRNILRDLVSLNVETTVCDPVSDARELASRQGAKQTFPSVGDLPNNLDGYIIASPAGQHLGNIEALLSTDRPVYVEKPLTIDVADARKLEAIPGVEERVFVMHKWRFHPGVRKLSDLVSNGELGRVIGLRLQRTNWAETHQDVDCALQLLPHDLSIVLHLLGYLPAVEIVVANPLGGSRIGLWASLFDEYRQRRVTLEANNMLPGNVRSCAVGFEQGVAILSSHHPEEIRFQRFGDEAVQSIPTTTEMPLLLELKAFLEHLQGEMPPMSPISDEIQILECISEIRERLHSTDIDG